VGRLRSSERAALGIAHVPEGRRVFPSLTVMENLELGSYRRAARAGRAEAQATVLEQFPILRQRRTQLAGSLSGGEQQMLALGRGLMARPDLLLLDEPSQGLGPRIVEQIFETIDRIRRERRLTILLVEQRVVEALELCDRGYVLETGRVVLEGPREALLADTRVQRAYLGA
jgi:branched-chain amino acid transport system ATP-binding protein